MKSAGESDSVKPPDSRQVNSAPPHAIEALIWISAIRDKAHPSTRSSACAKSDRPVPYPLTSNHAGDAYATSMVQTLGLDLSPSRLARRGDRSSGAGLLCSSISCHRCSIAFSQRYAVWHLSVCGALLDPLVLDCIEIQRPGEAQRMSHQHTQAMAHHS